MVSLHNVLEIVPVDKFPEDIGPLTFVAFVRNLPTGPGKGAFVLRDVRGDAPTLGRFELEADVPAGYVGRQIALHVNLPSVPLNVGGWFQVDFEWEGEVLGTNGFAVGARAAPEKPDGGAEAE